MKSFAKSRDNWDIGTKLGGCITTPFRPSLAIYDADGSPPADRHVAAKDLLVMHRPHPVAVCVQDDHPLSQTVPQSDRNTIRRRDAQNASMSKLSDAGALAFQATAGLVNETCTYNLTVGPAGVNAN